MLEIYLLTPFLIVTIIITISVLVGVPYLPTHKKQAELMMRLGKVEKGTRVVDLGSGAGRLLFLAARRGAWVTGYELNPFLVYWSRGAALAVGLRKNIKVVMQSLYKADVSEADVVFTFLMPRPMQKLATKLFNEMKQGSLIVSYTFPIVGKQHTHKQEGIFIYRVD